MQDAPKAVWSIPHVSVAFCQSLKHNSIAYRSSNMSWRPDRIFEIHQLWQSGFSRVYSNCCCSCWFESEIIKIGQSYHKMYSNNIVNFQESTTILNACTKRSGNVLKEPCKYQDLTWELKKTMEHDRGSNTNIVRALWTIPKGLWKGLEDLEIRGQVETIQTSGFQRSARILWRVLETCCHSNSCEKPSTNVGVKSLKGEK